MIKTRHVLVYTLADPTTGDIRYVGITCRQFWQRMKEHMRCRSETYSSRWIRKLKREGHRPISAVVATLETWAEACLVEQRLIATIPWLTNITPGGEGCPGPMSQAKRDAISAGNKGKPKSEAHRKALSEAAFKRWSDPALCARRSEEMKARWKNPDFADRVVGTRMRKRNCGPR